MNLKHSYDAFLEARGSFHDEVRRVSQYIANETNRLGGLTINLRNQQIETRGFAVAMAGYASKHKVPARYNVLAIKLFLATYIIKHADNLMFTDGYLLGTWLHEGYLYLDLVAILNNKELAREVGRLNQQIAIYDLTNKEEIML